MTSHERHGVSNYRQMTVCKKKTSSQIHPNNKENNQSSALLALCEGNPLGTGGFPPQRACYVDRVSMPWRHGSELFTKDISLLCTPTGHPRNCTSDSRFCMFYLWLGAHQFYQFSLKSLRWRNGTIFKIVSVTAPAEYGWIEKTDLFECII